MSLITLKEVYEKFKEQRDLYVCSITLRQENEDDDYTDVNIRCSESSISHKESVLGE